MSSVSIGARYIFPVAQPPLAYGTVVIANGKIAALEPRGARLPDLDLGNAAIIPGLVNCHGHLDLTGLKGQCPPCSDFTQWLRAVIAHRRMESPTQVRKSIRAGIAQCLATGTTLVGDIAAEGASWELLAAAPLRAVVFHELIGLPSTRALHAFQTGYKWLMDRVPTGGCRAGLSPHAPFSASKWLLEECSILAGSRNAPLAVHLAETRDEVLLLKDRQGPFVPFLKELDAWVAEGEGLAQSPEEVIKLTLPARPLLLVHCNYLSPDVELHEKTSIIYCPRTHAAFGHAPHPFREFLKRAARVALGTDSLASNPDLDMLAELRFLHGRCPDFPLDALLRLGTLAGAEALGWADETGSLAPGKSADLAVVPLHQAEGDPYRVLFQSSFGVTRTMCRGEWIVPEDFEQPS